MRFVSVKNGDINTKVIKNRKPRPSNRQARLLKNGGYLLSHCDAVPSA